MDAVVGRDEARRDEKLRTETRKGHNDGEVERGVRVGLVELVT